MNQEFTAEFAESAEKISSHIALKNQKDLRPSALISVPKTGIVA
jgi:hypothetical protein